MTTTNLWDRLTASYPALATTVAGESPLKAAVDKFAEGSCATKITKKDIALDVACQDDSRSQLDVTCWHCDPNEQDDAELTD